MDSWDRRLDDQMFTRFSSLLPEKLTNSLFSFLQGNKGEGGINGSDGSQGVRGEKVRRRTPASLVAVRFCLSASYSTTAKSRLVEWSHFFLAAYRVWLDSLVSQDLKGQRVTQD